MGNKSLRKSTNDNSRHSSNHNKKGMREICNTCHMYAEKPPGANLRLFKGSIRRSHYLRDSAMCEWDENINYSVGTFVQFYLRQPKKNTNTRKRENNHVLEKVDPIMVMGCAMCIHAHKSTEENFPRNFPAKHVIFPIVLVMENMLTQFGLLKDLSEIVRSYLEYSAFWWPVCSQNFPPEGQACGNLAGLSGLCYQCEPSDSKIEPLGSGLIILQDPDQMMLSEAILLLQRNFHPDMSRLISHCVARTPDAAVRVTSCRTWCVNHAQLGLVGSVVWRCVCVRPTGYGTIRLLEVLFLATREDVAHMDVAGELARYLVNYARMDGFDIIAVAAVPVQGVGFWAKQGFKHLDYNGKITEKGSKHGKKIQLNKSPRNKSASKKEEEEEDLKTEVWLRTYGPFLLAHMVVFKDTKIFALEL